MIFKNGNWNTMRANLSWTHYRKLIFINDINKINYYIKITIE